MARTDLYRKVNLDSSEDYFQNGVTSMNGPIVASHLQSPDALWNSKRLKAVVVVAFLTAVLVISLYRWIYDDINWHLVDEVESDGWVNSFKSTVSQLAPYLYHAFLAVLLGLGLGTMSWMMIYLDSAVPGIQPPTPFSPRELREASGHTFHLNYVVAILNGVFVGIVYFIRQLRFEDCQMET